MAVAADGVSAEAAAVGAAVESSVLFLGGLAGGINWTTVPTNIWNIGYFPTALPLPLELCSKIILQSTCSDM